METVSKTLIQDSIYYEKSTCPHCNNEIFVRYQQEPKVQILGIVDNNGVITNKSGNQDIDVIYKFWNSQHIIVHRKLTTDIVKTIKEELKNYTQTEIMQSIKNYAEIQKGEQYWFKYAWTLKDFLKRGITKFLDLSIAKKNYYKPTINLTTEKQIHKQCMNCRYKAFTADTICPMCHNRLERDYTARSYAHLIKR